MNGFLSVSFSRILCSRSIAYFFKNSRSTNYSKFTVNVVSVVRKKSQDVKIYFKTSTHAKGMFDHGNHGNHGSRSHYKFNILQAKKKSEIYDCVPFMIVFHLGGGDYGK